MQKDVMDCELQVAWKSPQLRNQLAQLGVNHSGSDMLNPVDLQRFFDGNTIGQVMIEGRA